MRKLVRSVSFRSRELDQADSDESNRTGRRRDLRARIDAAAKQQNRKGGKKKKAQDEEVRLLLHQERIRL